MFLEISIHSNYNKIYDSTDKKKKAKKQKIYNLSILSLLTVIDAEVVKESIESLEDKSTLEIIASFCSAVLKFVKNTVWCIANPIKSLIILLEYFAPLVLFLAITVPILGLICRLWGVDKFYKWDSKSLILSPLLFLLIYKVVIIILQSITF